MTSNNAAKAEMWDVSRLIKYENNMRLHPQTQIEVIKRSINEYGFINPIIVTSDGIIVAGHGRLEAVTQLGMSKVPVLIVDYLSDEQVRAYRLSLIHI